jgi:cation:H+ antiporter
MALDLILFSAGLLLLYYGAESLVSGSSRLALSFGIRPLIIGMTIVAFATSMPEMTVTLMASLKGSSDIAAGNIVGSNIANIGLILGIAAILVPMSIAKSVLYRELPYMLAVSVVVYLLAADGQLSFLDGMILFALLLVFLGYCLSLARKSYLNSQTDTTDISLEKKRRGSDWILIVLGIIGLCIGAEMMVRSAVSMARTFGISELVIAMSVVALGTSLPELAASTVSAWKGEMDLSIGNVIGSNIFNLLFVLGVAPMIRPIAVDSSLLTTQIPVMLAFSLGLIVLVIRRKRLSRRSGVLLLGGYLVFILTLFL